MFPQFLAGDLLFWVNLNVKNLMRFFPERQPLFEVVLKRLCFQPCWDDCQDLLRAKSFILTEFLKCPNFWPTGSLLITFTCDR